MSRLLAGYRPIDFCNLTGMSYDMVMRVLRGERKFSADTCIAIENYTKGKIKRTMLRPDLWPPRRKAE